MVTGMISRQATGETGERSGGDQAELMRLLRGPEGPRIFIEKILGETLDEQQIPVCDAFAVSRRVAVKSGHSAGKDWLAARLALWFHCTHYPSVVITTAPTERQVKHVLWGELRTAYAKSKVPIGGFLLPDGPLLKSGDPRHYVIGFKAGHPESFQSFHVSGEDGEHAGTLIIVSEATGMEARMWPAIESLMSGSNAKMLLLGNALYDPASEFYAAFTAKGALYSTHTLSSLRSNYCSREYIEDIRATYGEGSPTWQARIEGEFPTEAADVLIPLGWIEAAGKRWHRGLIPGEGYNHAMPLEPRTLGLDVARFGSDHTVFMFGEGCYFGARRDRQGQDLMATCGDAIALAGELGVADEQIRVDDTGLGGGVTDRLREQGKYVTAVNFGDAPSPSGKEKFANVRAEMFWALRERFREGNIAIDPMDRILAADLSVLRTKMTSTGKIQLDDKALLKKRTGRSPDRADALALAAFPLGVVGRTARPRVTVI